MNGAAQADTSGQVDSIPRNLAAAAGAGAVQAMDQIWGSDDVPSDVGGEGGNEGDGNGGESVPTAPQEAPQSGAVAPQAVAPAVSSQPPVTIPQVLPDVTGLPAEILTQKLIGGEGTATPAATPGASGEAEEAAEEAKAQQTMAALPEKAQRDAFADLRRQLKEERGRRKDWESKASQATKDLESARSQVGQSTADALAAVTKELETAKAQITSMEAEVGRSNYERSREYQDKYAIPAQSIQTKMVKMAETVGGHTKDESKALVAKVLNTPPAQRAALLAQEAVSVQGALLSAAADHDEVAENASIALNNWKNRKAAVDEEQRRANQLGLVKHLFEDTEKATATLAQEGNVLFSRTQNDTWNKGVDERLAAVRGVLQSGDPSVLIKYIADGVSAPKWREMYWSTVKAYAKLKQEADGVLQASTGLGGGEGAAAESPAPAAPPPKSMNEVMDRVWGRA